MKPKSFNKRLQLNKQTVAKLEDHHLNRVKAGACTCRNTGCATWVWQECDPSITLKITICLLCETDTIGTCC